MAVLAGVGRLNVGWVFAGGVDAIVTIDTAPGDIGVVEYSWHPGNGLVAIVAAVTRYRVVYWFPFDLESIVATPAITDDRCVIHVKHRAPGRRRMTVLTNAGC